MKLHQLSRRAAPRPRSTPAAVDAREVLAHDTIHAGESRPSRCASAGGGRHSGEGWDIPIRGHRGPPPPSFGCETWEDRRAIEERTQHKAWFVEETAAELALRAE
jgi:hypothetical protein